MRIMYIATCDFAASGLGIRKKVYAQVRSLEQAGLECFLVTCQENCLVLIQKEEIQQRAIFFSTQEMYEKILNIVQEYQIEAVYIRFLTSNLFFYNFIKQLRKQKTEMILEFPCTPYDDSIDPLTLAEDKYYRNRMWKYVKFSTNYNEFKKVYHISSISLANGVDFEIIPPRIENDNKDIVLLGVASMTIWHGFDRIIRGIHNYYKEGNVKEKVYIRFVGTGPEYHNYRKLADQLGVNEYVSFLGDKFGDELTNEFNMANMAIGSLGIHRINLKSVSTIKTKEYCSRGLPFFIAYDEIDFDSKEKFILKFEPDESDIDVHKIVEFYHFYQKNCSSAELRKYAEERFSWDTIMQPVVTYINQCIGR